MAEKIQLDIVTPTKKLISTGCDEVYAPGSKGEFGVLPAHAPYLTTLESGVVRYSKGEKVFSAAVQGGFAQVVDDKVILLADQAVLPEDVDSKQLEHQQKDVESKLVSADVDVDTRQSLFAERDWLNACQKIVS